MLHTPVALWSKSFPLATPPVFLNPEYPGSGYQRSPSSSGSSAPKKSVEVQVPDETGAASVDHDAIRALATSVLVNAIIPDVPPFVLHCVPARVVDEVA